MAIAAEESLHLWLEMLEAEEGEREWFANGEEGEGAVALQRRFDTAVADLLSPMGAWNISERDHVSDTFHDFERGRGERLDRTPRKVAEGN